MNKKKCQIYAKFPITCFTVPIVGSTELNLTSDEIYKCLCAKAEVLEILPNGQMLNLDFTNYDKDNFVKPEVAKDEPKTVLEEEKVVEEDKKETEEVSEESTEEELTDDEEVVEESPVKTHEVSARNEQFQKQNNYKNRKNKNYNKR